MSRSVSMLRPLAITTLLVAGICGVAHADVYRWVDDHGEPHYSDRWVPGSELIKSNKPHPQSADSGFDTGASNQGKPSNANQNASEQLAQQKNAAAVKQDVAKIRESQCKQAQERYQKAIEARRLYKAPKEGDTDRTYMSDEETDKYRAQARSDVIDACGSAPAAAAPTPQAPVKSARAPVESGPETTQ